MFDFFILKISLYLNKGRWTRRRERCISEIEKGDESGGDEWVELGRKGGDKRENEKVWVSFLIRNHIQIYLCHI